VETKLIELYLLICRLYDTQPILKQQRLSNNHRPPFSDEELLTIYIFGHLQGLTTQRRIIAMASLPSLAYCSPSTPDSHKL
jgi:hypothetical protein